MPRAFTRVEVAADNFDRNLFHLIRDATELSQDRALAKGERAKWRDALVALQTARPFVRGMMHPETRAETV